MGGRGRVVEMERGRYGKWDWTLVGSWRMLFRGGPYHWKTFQLDNLTERRCVKDGVGIGQEGVERETAV